MKQKYSDTKNNTLKGSKFMVLPTCCFVVLNLNAGSKPTEVSVSLFILSIGNFQVRDMVCNSLQTSLALLVLCVRNGVKFTDYLEQSKQKSQETIKQ